MRSSRAASSSCLAHRVGAADHDVAVLDHLVPRQVVLGLLVAGDLAHLRLVAGADRALGDVAGCIGEAGVDVQRAVEEVLGRFAVELVRLGIGVGDADELGDGKSVRVVVLAVRLDPAPVAADRLARPSCSRSRSARRRRSRSPRRSPTSRPSRRRGSTPAGAAAATAAGTGLT